MPSVMAVGTDLPMQSVVSKGDRDATSHRNVQHYLVAAEPDHRGDGNRGKNFHHRVIDGVCHDRVFVGVHVDSVDFGELLVRALLPIEKLQHHHAADMLLQVRIDARDGNTNTAVGIANLIAEDFGCISNKRQDRKRDQGDSPVHVQHDRHDSRRARKHPRKSRPLRK